MLLPLPANIVRKISLENHLALAAIEAGHGTPDTMIALVRVLYMTYFLLGKNVSDDDLEQFRVVEDVLNDSIHAAEGGRNWRVGGEHMPAIRQMLLQLDDLLGAVPKHRYVDACGKMGSFAESPDQSPLPGSRLEGIWE